MRFSFFLLMLLLVSCKPNSEKKGEDIASKSVDNSSMDSSLDWMIGAWLRSNEADGKQTMETWVKGGDSYTGHGVTLEKGDTIWQELMILSKKDTIWNLDIKQGRSEEASSFVISDIGQQYFVAECPEKEFPKQIIYQLDNDSLRAEISGGGPVIPFTFYKVAE